MHVCCWEWGGYAAMCFPDWCGQCCSECIMLVVDSLFAELVALVFHRTGGERGLHLTSMLTTWIAPHTNCVFIFLQICSTGGGQLAR